MLVPWGRGRWLLLEVRKRCRHSVIGICPRCYPVEARTRRNKKLALAIAWLERIHIPDPHITNLDQVRRIAGEAIQHISDLT
jgi:hypothetical protein